MKNFFPYFFQVSLKMKQLNWDFQESVSTRYKQHGIIKTILQRLSFQGTKIVPWKSQKVQISNKNLQPETDMTGEN